MGSRLLKSWIKRPLNSVSEIMARQNKVTDYYNNNSLRNDTIDILKQVSDIDRIVARLSANKSNPRDVINLLISLKTVDQLKKITPKKLSQLKKLLMKSNDF